MAQQIRDGVHHVSIVVDRLTSRWLTMVFLVLVDSRKKCAYMFKHIVIRNRTSRDKKVLSTDFKTLVFCLEVLPINNICKTLNMQNTRTFVDTFQILLSELRSDRHWLTLTQASRSRVSLTKHAEVYFQRLSDFIKSQLPSHLQVIHSFSIEVNTNLSWHISKSHVSRMTHSFACLW